MSRCPTNDADLVNDAVLCAKAVTVTLNEVLWTDAYHTVDVITFFEFCHTTRGSLIHSPTHTHHAKRTCSPDCSADRGGD
eukprot:m.434178 g.434178  ORF g.434178 m.434178 type:complete len:80 (-) comp96298_c0_seq1:5-244(-)